MKIKFLVAALLVTCLIGCTSQGSVLVTDPLYPKKTECAGDLAAFIASDAVLKKRLELDIRTGPLPDPIQSNLGDLMSSHPSAPYLEVVGSDVGLTALRKNIDGKVKQKAADMMANSQLKFGDDKIKVLQEIVPKLAESAQLTCMKAGYSFTAIKSISVVPSDAANTPPTPIEPAPQIAGKKSVDVAPAENTPIVRKVQEESPLPQEPAPIVKAGPPRVDLRSTIEVSFDEFTKQTKYEGANVAEDSRDLVFLRAFENGSQWLIQIYVMDHYTDWTSAGGWRLYRSAWGADGVSLETTLITRDFEQCGSSLGCSYFEHLGLEVTREYLEKHRQTGLRFKLVGKAGEEIFFIPAAHIDAFLEATK